MSFYFDIEIPENSDLHGILRKAGEKLSENNGNLWSDGRFELQTKIGEFSGSVVATKKYIRVTVDKKPGFISAARVEKTIRQMFEEVLHE